jgi:hypothetical protein
VGRASLEPLERVRQIVDPDEWEQVVDPAWGFGFGDWETGHEVEGWEASAWILHAMYENDELPAGLTHDDVDRIERAATEGAEELKEKDPRRIDSLADLGILVGSPGGATTSPGDGWERLRWTELAARLGLELFANQSLPGQDAFPYKSWPVSIRPPAMASLDLEQFERLIDHLGDRSSDGPDTECIWWFSPLAGDFLKPSAYRARLGEGLQVYSSLAESGGPNNIWPIDRAWFVWTDHDLWGTRVSGSRELIDALLADPDLDTLDAEPWREGR